MLLLALATHVEISYVIKVCTLCCQTNDVNHDERTIVLNEISMHLNNCFRAHDQNEMAINLGLYISQNYQSNEEVSDVYRLIGKWLAETRSSKLLDKLNSV
jgi:hypothetical protein